MNIGGQVDYRKLAELNRPSNPAQLTEEVRRLSTQGLTPIDISAALCIDLAQVREMLAATGDEAAQLHREAWR